MSTKFSPIAALCRFFIQTKLNGNENNRTTPAEQRRRCDDPIVARGILDDLLDLFKIAALEVHRGGSKRPRKVALGAFRELRE